MRLKEKKEIKKLYDDMESIIKMNPQLYIMPKELYNKIFKKIIGLERALKNSRKSRDMWRKRFESK